MKKVRKTLEKVKKYSGMISMAATAGLIFTTLIMKIKK
jgi:hypothetical protein